MAAWGARRCDSAMRRRSSRSCLSREGASSGRVVDFDDDSAGCAALGEDVWSGGREDCG